MTVPFLVDFKPYRFNGDECRSIDDMISISIQQTVPVSSITYNIGSTDDINIPLQIKNLTNNADLEVMVMFDKNIFVIDGADSMIRLKPENVRTLVIRLNKPVLNQALEKLLTTITFEIKNVLNGTVVTKSPIVTMLPISSLTETVDIAN
jgi:hypothetical protein